MSDTNGEKINELDGNEKENIVQRAMGKKTHTYEWVLKRHEEILIDDNVHSMTTSVQKIN